MRVIGMDSGSTTTKAVVFSDGKLLDKHLRLTAGAPKAAMEEILAKFDYDPDRDLVVSTGYGRKLLASDRSVTEITCHSRGARFLCPEVRSIIDIGGQDSKTICLSPNGDIEEFNMNDKCAAGTGRFVEVMMRVLGEELPELDEFIQGASPVKINSMCTVFAETEVISLIAQGAQKQDVALGVLQSIAERVANQFFKTQPSASGKVFFSGGLSQSIRIKEILSEAIGRPVETDPLAQYTGAIGAAVIGTEMQKKG